MTIRAWFLRVDSEIIIILEAVLLDQLKCVCEALFVTNLNIQYFDD